MDQFTQRNVSDDEPSDYYILKSGKKRERATQACSPCRKKKKKCDGAKPNCRNCTEAGLECGYAECKRRGPRKGYVQLLEERLALLERRLTGMPPSSTGRPTITATTKQGSRLYANSSVTGMMIPQTELNGGSLDDVTMPSEEVVLHLVDFFFKYINSIFPLIHHHTLVQSIKDGTISQPLLWSVMAIGARFSDHPDIKTDPPYWAGEKFARKAGSLINNDLFEPTVPNLQFWGVMACLEYGRAAGSRAWIYGGLAARLCFELGFHKEETIRSPIYKKDGTLDRVAMLMRRRIFWSCFNIDKYGSAGNSRPQFFGKGDYDVGLPDDESLALLNPESQNVTVNYKPVTTDSLASFIKHYLSLMELFGDVIKGLQRAKSNQGKAIWPPMDEFDQLNDDLQAWKHNLPPHMDFSLDNLDYHLERASRGKINHYLCAHVIWRTLVLALHRGSLAYVDKKDDDTNNMASSFSQHTWERIQYSVNMCKQVVNDVMPVFRAMKDICGVNVIPYMGYSSYMFATILMTSAFTKTEEQHRKGTKGLLLLYDMIELLRPYWPVCERLSITTRDLIVSHSRMYEYSQETHHKRTHYEVPLSPKQEPIVRPPSFTSYSSGSSSAVATPSSTISPIAPASSLSNTSTLLSNTIDMTTAAPFAGADPFTASGTIDFNSSAFLYDTGLFGQIMFDETKFMNNMTNNNNNNNSTMPSIYGIQQPMAYNNDNNNIGHTGGGNNNTKNGNQGQSSPATISTSPTSYIPSQPSQSPQQQQPSTSQYGKRIWNNIWQTT
ncbi:fungal-specific transcription factor domain-containing protein [Halteromyces radiatus]|uniref:fungal-specific transcription factor domain-containing protein n=1 Tax=Halteromyces radiatus TaxID=101107 RepID=UPI00221EC351|nr:fungal-specific transcription factor domain-containing protein [Halteromyces radiatus]KAI8082944.1 fungal-specific transcription factor domain-containing protein [Halteromyces radiatus]